MRSRPSPINSPISRAFITKSGWSATASFIARWSMPAARHGCWVSATCCTSRANATAGLQSAVKSASRAMWWPSTPRSSIRFGSAMRTPPSPHWPNISRRRCNSSNSQAPGSRRCAELPDHPEQKLPAKKIRTSGGNKPMNISRRHALASLVAAAVLSAPAAASAETIRVGLPTKTYWPTTIAETALRQKLFEKEGISAELTIYRGGAETFEAMAAGAADIILDPPSLVSAGRKKGVMSRIVANAAMGSFGWQLMVPVKSTIEVKDLNGKKVAITSAGSGSDLLALWTIQDKKIDFTRVPVGCGGLVPNLLASNVEAAAA